MCYVRIDTLGVNKFKPCPQNRLLVRLRGSFQNFRGATPSFFYRSLSLGEGRRGPWHFAYSLSVTQNKCIDFLTFYFAVKFPLRLLQMSGLEYLIHLQFKAVALVWLYREPVPKPVATQSWVNNFCVTKMPGYPILEGDKQNLEDKFICEYCQSVLRDATRASCGHFFCSSCVKHLFLWVLLHVS